MKILIADDSPTPRLLLKRELERLGHECLVAEDGLQAWETFQGSGVDAVISDWMMPGLDGDELCRRVRADPDAPYAYFVLLTSLDDKRHVVAGMEAGADDYLTKPFGHEDLETRLIAAARVSALHRQITAQQAELQRLNQMLFDDSRRDSLTGLGNRRSQDEELRRSSSARSAMATASASPCSTSTASRRSTTAPVTWPATGCCARWPPHSPRSAAAATPCSATAARRCCSSCPRRRSRRR
jgi:PleD family two-component response regulator